jgi:hypothetical protein
MHRDPGNSDGCVPRRILGCGRRAVTSANALGFAPRFQRPRPRAGSERHLDACAVPSRCLYRALDVPVPSLKVPNPHAESKKGRKRVPVHTHLPLGGVPTGSARSRQRPSRPNCRPPFAMTGPDELPPKSIHNRLDGSLDDDHAPCYNCDP